jgi:hypothetical protein
LTLVYSQRRGLIILRPRVRIPPAPQAQPHRLSPTGSAPQAQPHRLSPTSGITLLYKAFCCNQYQQAPERRRECTRIRIESISFLPGRLRRRENGAGLPADVDTHFGT